MRYEHITLECIEGVATITINRPEVLNALSMQTLDEMMDALDSVAAMGARTLLLRGAGRAFCSGADLSGGVQEGSVANSDTVSKIGLMYCQGQLR